MIQLTVEFGVIHHTVPAFLTQKIKLNRKEAPRTTIVRSTFGRHIFTFLTFTSQLLIYTPGTVYFPCAFFSLFASIARSPIATIGVAVDFRYLSRIVYFSFDADLAIRNGLAVQTLRLWAL